MNTDSLQGKTLGKYRVLEPLGRGGMARVYRAYHPQLNRYVAVKMLRSDLIEDEEFLARFRREAQAVAGLRHTNIVQVFDFDVQDDAYYMVMELLEGDTLKARLSDYLVRGERMPLGEVVRILLDVLDGLAYAHSEGMIHRDVKPANIMLTKRGQAVITDFGIARIIGGTRHTAAGALMGTLNYIAPEQGLEGKSDARSDIYSLGIVLYEMLMGNPPFDADTPLAILMKHLNDPLPLPRQIDAGIPEPLERIVLKALAKGPEDRYQGAEEMAQALREAAAEAGVELPERISLPLSFTTAAAPSESVAVLSGTAREKIPDAQFARDDTDATLGERLAEAAAAGGGAPSAEAADAASEAVQPQAGIVLTLSERLAEPLEGGRPVLMALAFLVGFNLLAVPVGILTGRWVFGRGWPAELLLVSLMLSALMYSTSSIRPLIPANILLGNGLILGYCSLTGWWHHWAWLWVLEPFLVVGTVIYVARTSSDAELARLTSRRLGRQMWKIALGASIVVALGALILG